MAPPTSTTRPGAGRARRARSRVGHAVDALEELVAGLGTSVLALLTVGGLLVVAILSLVAVGVPLIDPALRGLRSVANRERERLARARGDGPALLPEPLPARGRDALNDPTVRREAAWAALHGTIGLALGLLGVTLPLTVVRDVTYPAWWHAAVGSPDPTAAQLYWPVTTWPGTLSVALVGVGLLTLGLVLLPVLARLQSLPGRRLLTDPDGTELSLRVARLTATRAAALDAHLAELRRIERSLHDGTQNRLVAVTVLLGAARRAVSRDPEAAEALLERAQEAAEEALRELRSVARAILPPVLSDRSLADAVASLVSTCPVPCELRLDLPVRCAASLEATAYYAVAEALTNVVRHSGATQAQVEVRHDDAALRVLVHDDGHGGAVAEDGTGLAGIRRRAEAHDGVLVLTSPAGGPTTVEVVLPCVS